MTRRRKGLCFLAAWLLFLGHLDGQIAKAPEPELFNVIYQFDQSTNALVALERVTAEVATRVRALGFGGARATAEIKGTRAPLRLRAGEPMEFVVQLPSGVDPSKFQLFRFEIRDRKRVVLLAKAGAFTGSSSSIPGLVQINAGRHGTASYKLAPAGELGAGEYGFSASDSNDVFCFGVDAKTAPADR